MARNARGQFTVARRRQRNPGLFMGREPIEGIEVNGVVTGETVVLGEGQTSGGGGPVAREAKSKS